ncbi:MAG: translation initiation factor IF-3 [Verrucomicrobiales bacterium]|nr:translation initiation factor IF-3 [Verrucomicrobiales bacterium]
MSRPFPPRHAPAGPSLRINGKIRAREVRVIGDDGQQLGVIPLSEAIVLARNKGVDLVEIAPNANPPVCRLIEFGKYKYEMEKRQKENRKSQHANKVKEIQLSANIDPHDFKTKVTHAIEFLCEDMKVKASLRFRGREMAHTEFGFKVVRQFIADIAPWGHPDFEPKLTGRSINVMVSPLPRAKRAKPPEGTATSAAGSASPDGSAPATPAAPVGTAPTAAPTAAPTPAANPAPRPANPGSQRPKSDSSPSKSSGFSNNPFDGIQLGGGN